MAGIAVDNGGQRVPTTTLEPVLTLMSGTGTATQDIT
jgi:hypothetical protein